MQILFKRTIIVDRVEYRAGDVVSADEITKGQCLSLLSVGDVEEVSEANAPTIAGAKSPTIQAKPEATSAPATKPNAKN